MSTVNKPLNGLPIAIIMCVYKNDTKENLELAIESILNQEVVSPHLYIFVDGPLAASSSSLLSSYLNDDRVTIEFNDKNIGLAAGLNWLIDNAVDLCVYDYIARMDADDISVNNRLFLQVSKMKDTGAAVIGTDCYEINNNGETIFHKKMQSSDELLKENIVKRCPFIHPSVVFDTKIFKAGHRYNPSLMNTQDYYLWVDLASNGYTFSNVNEPLLLFRVNESFHKRRGIKKSMNEFKGRIYAMKKLKAFTAGNCLFTVLLFALRLMPATISSLAYKYFR